MRTHFRLAFLLPVFSYLFAGILAGFLNGLLGTGGGVILVLFFRRVYEKRQGNEAVRDAFATTVVCILVLSLFSLFQYHAKGLLPLKMLLRYLPSALLGGALGAFLLGKIKLGALKQMFRILLILAGGLMIIKALGGLS